MENPVSTVTNAAKSAIRPKNILYVGLGVLAVFAILNLAGWTDYFIYPVDAIKAKFKKTSA